MNDTVAPDIKAAPAETAPPPTGLVLFGRDENGKPHASKFDASEAALAEKAAGLMGMRVLPLGSEELVSLAASLPAGKVFASGRGFVPFVGAKLFAQLAAAPGAFAPARPAEADAPPATGKRKGGVSAQGAGATGSKGKMPASEPGKPVTDPADIVVGSVVLAAEEGEPGTWYAVKVLDQRGTDLFQLQWIEYPDEPVIIRRREHLALLPVAVADLID